MTLTLSCKTLKRSAVIKNDAILKWLNGSTSLTKSLFIIVISTCIPYFRLFKETPRSQSTGNKTKQLKCSNFSLFPNTNLYYIKYELIEMYVWLWTATIRKIGSYLKRPPLWNSLTDNFIYELVHFMFVISVVYQMSGRWHRSVVIFRKKNGWNEGGVSCTFFYTFFVPCIYHILRSCSIDQKWNKKPSFSSRYVKCSFFKCTIFQSS